MQILLSPRDPRTHRFQVIRPPHEPADALLETRSMLVHDLAHYAWEADSGCETGFYGLLAAGVAPGSLRDPNAMEDRAMWEALLSVEQRVVRLQSAFRKGAPYDGLGMDRLRSIHGAWSKTRHGQTLVLTWPPGPPTVRPIHPQE